MSKLPSVDAVLVSEGCIPLIQAFGRTQVTKSVRACLSDLRQKLKHKQIKSPPDTDQLLSGLRQVLMKDNENSLKSVINLTGTVLHTNLGRAILPKSAINAMIAAASQATNLEYDLQSGRRGDRDHHVQQLLIELTGAEAATVVNNNAAAVLIVLNTLAMNREVPVSRGELVEIGGSFRIPEIMKKAGCKLVEIGTTNRTHLKDYEAAINANTGLLMKVHTSNYQIQGFTKSVSDQEIGELAKQHDLPLVTDLGSGTLVDLREYGLPYEPTVSEAIDKGADLVTFSGDKLLGGPQAGIIAGKKALIAAINENPLKRALRVDKTTIAALAEILSLYRNPEGLVDDLPTLRHLTRRPDEILKLAEKLVAPMTAAFGHLAEISIKPVQSQIGSGSLPTDFLPSIAIALQPKHRTSEKPMNKEEQLLKITNELKNLPTPILGRLHNGEILLDLRCLESPESVLSQLPPT